MTLPPPDTHCWDEDTSKDVWSHSADQMRAYAEQAVAAERERCATVCEAWMEEAERHSGPEAAGWLHQVAQHIRGSRA